MLYSLGSLIGGWFEIALSAGWFESLRDSLAAYPDAAWYPDPEDPSRWAWWDGTKWVRPNQSFPIARREFVRAGWYHDPFSQRYWRW